CALPISILVTCRRPRSKPGWRIIDGRQTPRSVYICLETPFRPCGLAPFQPATLENRLMWQGVFDLTIWGHVLAALALTHVTIASVTIYLHRHQAHRSLDLHPAASHFFRFWLWLTTGIVTKEWVAVHRKHHAHCETADD